MTTAARPRAFAILGAGAMGSALATPLRGRGHAVRLWGTHLDAPFLDAYAAGGRHPGTGERMPDGVVVEHHDRLGAALDGSDAVIVAVASDAVAGVMHAAAAHVDQQLVLMVTKGFHRRADGTVGLMPEAVVAGLGRHVPVVAVGGPCKANEVAAGRVTATAYASDDPLAARRAAELIATDAYRIEVGDDIVGLEVAAALKNVFAIALGIADGLGRASGVPWHNLRSAIFARGIAEMTQVAEMLGGRARTVSGLAGVGDLEVTGLSGRNKVFGERLGSGEGVASARASMHAAGLTIEGVAAAEHAMRLAQQLGPAADLRLLTAVADVLAGAPAEDTIIAAI